jgi:TP901 family phage tail tape measure protein
MFGGGYNLGNAHGRVEIDAAGVRAGMAEAQRTFASGIRDMGQRAQALGQNMQAVGTNLSVMTAPLALLGKQGIQAAGRFEDVLAEIQARTGATAEVMDAVQAKAFEMGQATAFSATEANEAMLQLLSSGYDIDQTFQALQPTLDLAAAGHLDLGYAADAVTDILAQFRLGAAQSTAVTDALARASGSSSATIADLIDAYANVGPVAANFGLSVDDTAAALAVFAENGIKGAESGTQLRSMLNNMSRNVPAVQNMWNNLGISMYDTEGNVRDLNAIIQDLNDATEHMADDERNLVIQTLAGTYGQMGLSALLAADGTEAMTAAMDGAADAGTIADARMSTFNGAIKFLTGSVQTLMIQAFLPFIQDTLTPLIRHLADAVNGVMAWVQANPELTQQIIKIGAVLLAAGPALIGIGQGFKILGALLGALVSPMSLIAALFAGLGLALSTNAFGIRDALQPAFESLFTFLHDIALPALGELAAWFIDDALPSVVQFVTATVVPALRRFALYLGGLWDRVAPGLRTLHMWFSTILLPALRDILDNQLIPLFERFGYFLGDLWRIVGPGLQELTGYFTQWMLPTILDFITGSAIPTIRAFIALLASIWDAVSPALLALADWIINTGLPAAMQFITNRVIPVLSGFVDGIRPILGGIKDFVDRNPEFVGALGLVAGAFLIANPLIKRGQGLIGGMTTAAKLATSKLGLFAGVLAAGGAAIAAADKATGGDGTVEGGLKKAGESLKNLVGIMVVGVTGGVMIAGTALRNWVDDAREKVPLVGEVFDALEGVIQGVIGTINGLLWTIVNIPQAVQNVKNALFGGGDSASVVSPTMSAEGRSGANTAIYTGGNGRAIQGRIAGVPAMIGNGPQGAVPLARVVESLYPSRDRGGPGRAFQHYRIGAAQTDDEIFVPRTDGQFIPNFLSTLEAMQGGGGDTINVTVNAGTYEEGQAAARGFMDVYERRKRQFNG